MAELSLTKLAKKANAGRLAARRRAEKIRTAESQSQSSLPVIKGTAKNGSAEAEPFVQASVQAEQWLERRPADVDADLEKDRVDKRPHLDESDVIVPFVIQPKIKNTPISCDASVIKDPAVALRLATSVSLPADKAAFREEPDLVTIGLAAQSALLAVGRIVDMGRCYHDAVELIGHLQAKVEGQRSKAQSEGARAEVETKRARNVEELRSVAKKRADASDDALKLAQEAISKLEAGLEEMKAAKETADLKASSAFDVGKKSAFDEYMDEVPKQRLAFRGHDESENLSNQGHFLELLKFLADHNEDVKVVALSNAPQNLKLTSPDIQKDIVNVAAFETINVIIRDLGDALFSILINEARDMSIKEQMAIVIRYVDKKDQVIEHFLGIKHVANMNALSLKQAMVNLFSRLGLSISRLRGQGYDGASNMHSDFNGLKTLILKENLCAYYVHCFAHQLQLALVVMAKNHNQNALLFTLVSNVVNVVGASCKRRDIVKEKQAAKVAKALNTGELSSGQGLNQETNLKRASETRWGSHYGTLVCLASMFSTVIDVLEMILEDGSNSEQRAEANVLLDLIQSFEFVFNLHLTKTILAITSELSQALQRKDQDIVNAMNLHEIDVPQMDDMFVARGRKRRNAKEITNLHHYRAELFYTVLDMHIQELNARFIESNTELLLLELMVLNDQLDTYIIDMLSSNEFSILNGIADLAKKMVETGRDKVYPLVCLLLTLALILPITTATVERVFSAMNSAKNRLQNQMGD
ncbi:zinc finger MYM-type protein 1-like [Camellia sinensis]|uniref:zinc finger MYM-type protein 1-like n=1 Tax=Camellia sinensis TaxID=4442 RepID=UPI00103697D3|nr:zinc finger MYM-type protein 1-like [Camellia sinensis]